MDGHVSDPDGNNICQDPGQGQSDNTYQCPPTTTTTTTTTKTTSTTSTSTLTTTSVATKTTTTMSRGGASKTTSAAPSQLPVPAVQSALSPGPSHSGQHQDQLPQHHQDEAMEVDQGEEGPSTAAAVHMTLRRKRHAERVDNGDSKRSRLASGDQPGTSGNQDQPGASGNQDQPAGHSTPPAQATPPPNQDPGAQQGAVPDTTPPPILDLGEPQHASTPVQVHPQGAVPAFMLEMFGLEAEAAEISEPSSPSLPPVSPDAQYEDWDELVAEPPLAQQIPQDEHERRQWLLDTMAERTMLIRQGLAAHDGRATPLHVRAAVAHWCDRLAELVDAAGDMPHWLERHDGWRDLHRGVFIVALSVMVNEVAGEVFASRLPALRKQVYDRFQVAPGSRPILGRWVNENIAALNAPAAPAPVPNNPVLAPGPPPGVLVDVGSTPDSTPPSVSWSVASSDLEGLEGTPEPDEVFEPVAGPLAVAIANQLGQVQLAPVPLPVAPAPGMQPGRPVTRSLLRQHPDQVWQQRSKEDIWRQADLCLRTLRV